MSRVVRLLAGLAAGIALTAAVLAVENEQRIKKSEMPEAVQATADRESAGATVRSYGKGVEKGHPYKAIMRLLASPSGPEIAHYERSFQSDFEQAGLPEKPLVVGPGYQPNPNP